MLPGAKSRGSVAKVMGSAKVPVPPACEWICGNWMALPGGELSGKPYQVTIILVVVPPPPAAVTARLTVAECDKLPLTPVIVSVEVAAGVVLAVVMFKVEDPEPLTEVGLNEAVAPAGKPLTLSPTLPLKPWSALTFTV